MKFNVNKQNCERNADRIKVGSDLWMYDHRPDIPIRGKRWGEIHQDFMKALAETSPHIHMGDKTPRFTKPHGAYKYARIRAVADHCEESYDNLTTVWLSLSASEKHSGKWVDPLDHDDGFRSHAVKQAFYRVRQKLGIDKWAGLWLMAPRKTGYSHRHIALWIDAESVSEDDFHPVIDSHIRNHPMATESGNLYSDAIQIRNGDDCGSLPAEIARNLPEIGSGRGVPSPDVRSIVDEWKYVQVWCSFYWYTDRIRSYELGSFDDIAESLKPERDGVWRFGKGWVQSSK